jgi:hypothetical protein
MRSSTEDLPVVVSGEALLIIRVRAGVPVKVLGVLRGSEVDELREGRKVSRDL